jgi:hypothetical protein
VTWGRASGAPDPSRFPGSASTVEALASAVASEARLLEELILVLRKQRASVAAEDLAGVDDSVFATHRILVTLAEARRNRRAITGMLGEGEDVGLNGLEALLGGRMTGSLRAVRSELVSAASRLSREVEMNRDALRSALDSGSPLIPDSTGPASP